MITGFGSILKDYLEFYNISQVEFAKKGRYNSKTLK